MGSSAQVSAELGDLIGPVLLGAVAHGGHVVARHEGRVLFVRHGLPGERVMVRLTDVSRPSFWRADVVEVLEAAPTRVVPPCPVAGRCGGCDFQHASLPAQRELKTAVHEQLRRIGGFDLDALGWQVEVESVPQTGTYPGTDDGLGWRSRVLYRVEAGRVGLRAHRSHELVVLPDQGCLIATPEPAFVHLRDLVAELPAVDQLEAVDATPVTVLADGAVLEGAAVVVQRVLGRQFRVRADGFWQVHPRAAELLSTTVLDLLRPTRGERALDLYCGVGLFAGALVDAGADVVGVEISRAAVELARQNVPQARFISGPLERSLRRLPRGVDVVVLDPPRAGAGRRVVDHVSRLGARAIVLVGCDPASFARDLAGFVAQGHRVDQLRAFDLFPMTHHFESVALLRPVASS